jgi:hypothetical protein
MGLFFKAALLSAVRKSQIIEESELVAVTHQNGFTSDVNWLANHNSICITSPHLFTTCASSQRKTLAARTARVWGLLIRVCEVGDLNK